MGHLQGPPASQPIPLPPTHGSDANKRVAKHSPNDTSIQRPQLPSTPAVETIESLPTVQSYEDVNQKDEDAADESQIVPERLNRSLLFSLCAQHSSSSWGARCYEFAVFLFLIHIFPNSLLFPSVYGFVTTLTSIAFSGSVGSAVSRTPRLRFVRQYIIAQKVFISLAYAMLLISFDRIEGPTTTGLFIIIIFSGSLLKLANTGLTVCVERDWVTVIANENSDHLTTLNVYLRRIDLVTALVGPLFVSLLTTAASYHFAAAFLLGFTGLTALLEFFWIAVVFRRCPLLEQEELSRLAEQARINLVQTGVNHSFLKSTIEFRKSVIPSLRQYKSDWIAFYVSRIFPSSLAISLLYLTVLSFDGTLLAYLISHNWSPAILAAVRGLNVIMGLCGTIVMPVMEKRIGLVRAGTWSIISEVAFLLPVMLSFFIVAPPLGERGNLANATILFGFMALSRISLWSFDLVQTKQLQETLAKHPRKNTLTALQISLQSTLDLIKYVLTIALSSPALFKYAALVSWIAVLAGGMSYLWFVKRERGHVLHLGELRSLLSKKSL